LNEEIYLWTLLNHIDTQKVLGLHLAGRGRGRHLHDEAARPHGPQHKAILLRVGQQGHVQMLRPLLGRAEIGARARRTGAEHKQVLVHVAEVHQVVAGERELVGGVDDVEGVAEVVVVADMPLHLHVGW